MKTYILPALKISLVLLILLSGVYPLVIAAIGKLTPGGGDGATVTLNGKVVGFERIGQKFTKDEYFWGRPSSANYQGDAGAGSNKGPANPDYLKDVDGKITFFLQHNPGVTRQQIPAELVTYSGSGLDPDISPEAAKIQIARVAKARNLSADKLTALIDANTKSPLWGVFGPATVNVLKLNVALASLK